MGMEMLLEPISCFAYSYWKEDLLESYQLLENLPENSLPQMELPFIWLKI